MNKFFKTIILLNSLIAICNAWSIGYGPEVITQFIRGGKVPWEVQTLTLIIFIALIIFIPFMLGSILKRDKR